MSDLIITIIMIICLIFIIFLDKIKASANTQKCFAIAKLNNTEARYINGTCLIRETNNLIKENNKWVIIKW